MNCEGLKNPNVPWKMVSTVFPIPLRHHRHHHRCWCGLLAWANNHISKFVSVLFGLSIYIYEVINRHSKIIHKLSRTVCESEDLSSASSKKKKKSSKLSLNMWFCVTFFFISHSLYFFFVAIVSRSRLSRSVCIESEIRKMCGVFILHTSERGVWKKYHN